MKPIKTLALGASILAIGMSTAQAAMSGNSDYVKDVDLTFQGTPGYIDVKNTSGSKMLKDLKLAVIDSTLDIHYQGFVQCENDKDITFGDAEIYFGSISLQNGLINDTATLAQSDANPSAKFKISAFKWITESGGPEVFKIPVNQLKNGHPALRVDVLEELNKKLQSHLNNGGKEIDFYKKDQYITLKRPVSLVGWCKKGNKTLAGFEGHNYDVKIKYKGDPSLIDAPKLNAQVINNMPNQIQQNPNLPFQLNNIEFDPGNQNYVGKCLPNQNPKIRMNFKIAGGKQGLVDLRVKAVSNQYAAYGNYFETTGIVKNPKNGGGHLDFSFPLKEMLSQNKYAFMMQLNNKTYNHNMRIEARFKNFDGSNQWSQWQDYDQAVFKHRCTPQVAVPMGGAGGKMGFDNGGTIPKLNKVQPNTSPKPPRGPLGKVAPIEATPVKPKRAQ
ncbi:MAG: hypothetical protein PVG66_07265 [Chromatiales bacterium]|jgi:hypothetical protein